MVKNIVFDFGGVLLDWNPKYFYRTYFKDEKEMEYFLSHICTEEWNAECMLKGEFTRSVDLLKRLKGEGYGIYGLTNWSAETIPLVYSKYNFFQLFDGIVVSGEEKVIKPDPKIYRILLERYNLTAENTLFIDDNSANIETAKQLGFQTIVFDDFKNVSLQISVLTNDK